MTGSDHEERGLLVSGRFAELGEALCERVRELREGAPLRPLTIVVGSSALRTHVGDLLVRRLGALAGGRLVTLDELARDLATAGAEAPPTGLRVSLSSASFSGAWVRAAATCGTSALSSTARASPGALAATFADLRQAAVSPGAAWAATMASGGPPGEGARAKAADLERLYRAYCAELQTRGLLDNAELYTAAAAAVRRGCTAHSGERLPRASRDCRGALVLYGLYDLNQVQERLVEALIADGADVFVPAPRGAARDGLTILSTAVAAGLDESTLAARSRQGDREALAAVWWAADGSPPPVALSGDGTLAVVSVTDERAETREAVREVIAAAAAGASFWECAIVVPHADDAERVTAALEATGVPVAGRVPARAVGARALVRLVDCLAPAAGKPFARRAVVDLLSVAPPQADAAWRRVVAWWLDEARQAGVVSGLGEWVERLGRRCAGLDRRVQELEAHGPQADADDDEEIERLVTAKMRRTAARSLQSAVAALARACDSFPARATWGQWAELLAKAAEALFAPEVAVATADAARRLRGYSLLAEEVDVGEVAVALRELLASERRQLGRVGRDGVAVLAPLELRGLSFATVVFTGLAEGGFPSRGRPDPILGDRPRREIAAHLGVRLPLAEQRTTESLLLFGFACEAACKRLVLMAARSDGATGRPRLPSRLLLRFASLATGRPVGIEEFLEGSALAPVWRRVGGSAVYGDNAVWVDARERDTATLLSLSASGSPAAARAYLARVLGDEAAAARRLGAWRASRSPVPGPWDGLLGGESRAALQARHPFAAEMRPTGLERYITCPFAFLLRDVFNLEAPDEPDDALDIDARELGTLVHEILQDAYQRVIAENLGLAGALAACEEAWQTCCRRAERRGATGAALSWQVRREILLDDLREALRRDPVFAHTDGRPVAVEWAFGTALGRPVTVDLPGGRRLGFAGRLDRVDGTAAGARVIDYKTGVGSTEKARSKEGLSVQLPIYQLAVRQAGAELFAGQGGVAPATVTSLYRLVTRRGGFEDVTLPGDEAAAGASLSALVADAVELIEAGMFPRSTRGRCDFCDLRYACGVSAWARERKRHHEALAGVVRLQEPVREEAAGDA